MRKQIVYGITCSCIGIALGFAIGFAIFYQLPYEKRGYIGVPMMLGVCIGLGVIGAVIGVKIAGPEFPGEEE
jgi:hypothetical protein